MSNFFKELMNNNFFEEKTASEHETIKSTLDTVTPELLEKLADEIGVMMDKGPMVSLEEKLAGEEDKEEKKEEKEEPTDPEASDDKEEENKEEEDKEEKKEEEPTDPEASDDEKEEDKEEKKEEKEEPTDPEASDDENKEEDKEEKKEEKEEPTNPEASDDEKEDEKEEEDKEEEECNDNKSENCIKKEAYELANEKLAEAGVSISEYIFNKTANEDLSLFIADKAEKLAFLTDKPALMVADEILNSVSEKLN